MLTAAVRAPPKIRIASHFRRLHTASANSTPEPLRGWSSMACSVLPAPRLRDHDDVAGLEEEVLLFPARRSDFVVVEGDAPHAPALGTKHHDLRAGCKLAQATRLGQ